LIQSLYPQFRNFDVSTKLIHLHEVVHIPRWGACRLLVRLGCGNEPPAIIQIDPSDLSDPLTCGGFTTTFSRSTWPIQNLRPHQQFYWPLFFGCDEGDRSKWPATAGVLARGRTQVLGVGAGSRTPFIEGFVRRLL